MEEPRASDPEGGPSPGEMPAAGEMAEAPPDELGLLDKIREATRADLDPEFGEGSP